VTNSTNPQRHRRHSVLAIPANAHGIRLVRPLTVFGYDDAVEGHFEVEFDNVRVPADCLILGEGRGFEVMQGRLGPGAFDPLKF
jgi:acyl-CoA dehydrogenase